MSPTPRQARQQHQHRRKSKATDRTRNTSDFRVEGSWNARPDRPAAIRTPDRRRAYRIARQWAATGAYVIVQEHEGWERWRTLDEIDGPAQQAEERRREQAAAEQARRAAEDAERRLADAARRDRELAALDRLMVRPPVPRDATGRVAARHTAGGR